MNSSVSKPSHDAPVEAALIDALTEQAPDAMSDLILRVGTGDREAFRLLYLMTTNRLFASAMRIVRNRPLAEDVLQDTYIRVWRYSKTFRPERSGAWPWLTQIMRNRAIDLRAQYGKHSSWDAVQEASGASEAALGDVDAMSDNGSPIESGVTYEIRDAALARCFEQLDGQSRQVLYLSFTYGLSHAEIAERLRVPLGTAKTWCRQALIELKRRLDQDTPAASRGANAPVAPFTARQEKSHV